MRINRALGLLLFAVLSTTLFAQIMLQQTDVYRGTSWHQTCDSQGSHNNASISVDISGTLVRWLPTVRPPGQSWDNVYIWQSNPITPAATFSYSVDATLLDAGSYDSLNAFEFETQVVRNGKKYNLAWQALKSGSQVIYRTFDFANQQWVSSGIVGPASDFTVGKPSRFIALYEINDTGPHHIGLSVNGRFYAVDIQRGYVTTNENPYINFAFQFDGLNKAEQINALVETDLTTF